MRHLFISHSWKHDQKRFKELLDILNESFNYDCHMLDDGLRTDAEKKNDIMSKVGQCHCIVILGGYYDADKDIIEMELLASGECNKPIVTIAPNGVESVNKRVKEKSNDVIK